MIALLVGGFGLTALFAAWPMSEREQDVRIVCDWTNSIIGVALVALSCLIATGRNWARYIVIVLVVLVGGFYTLGGGLRIVMPPSVADASPQQAKVIGLSGWLYDLSWFTFTLTVFVFAMLLLCHPDVVASFRGRSRREEKV